MMRKKVLDWLAGGWLVLVVVSVGVVLYRALNPVPIALVATVISISLTTWALSRTFK